MDTPKPRIKRFMRLAGAAASGALLLGALAACGSDGGSGGGEEPPDVTFPSGEVPTASLEPTGEVPTEPEVTDMPDQTPYLDPSMGSDKPGANAAMTITGTIEPGVESGCLVMTYEGTVYGIFGRFDKSVVRAGAEVTLHGHLDREMISFCQQGTPFVVEEAESAG